MGESSLRPAMLAGGTGAPATTAEPRVNKRLAIIRLLSTGLRIR
jgi:hypothetical protein